MKLQRAHFRLLAVLIIGMLFVAGLYGVYSVSTYGSRWFSNSKNTRYQAAKASVTPGDIYDRNGVKIATSDANGDRVYQSNIKSRRAIVHLLGDQVGNVANGVDSFQSAYLLGFETSLAERVQALLTGQTRRGDDVRLTVDSALCTYAVSLFEGAAATRDKGGAAVVLNYRTGEVLALVSLPVFDPQNVSEADEQNPLHPFWNRATQSTLPPGSTFKIITAASALENIDPAGNLEFTCTGATQVQDRLITDYQNGQHGKETLKRAFAVSCNNAFAQLALTLGDEALRKTAEAFGFNENFLFRDVVLENSVYPTTGRSNVEIAWSGAGQSRVAATPLHMCMVAAAIANDGVMMEPRLLASVTSPTGIERLGFSSKAYRRAVAPAVARVLDEYMKNVTENGTGTRASVPGLVVAGKTGSAESSLDGKDVTHAWYVGYIDNADLPFAVCVLVEDGGSGGSVAAPIAGRLFAYLQEHYGK